MEKIKGRRLQEKNRKRRRRTESNTINLAKMSEVMYTPDETSHGTEHDTLLS